MSFMFTCDACGCVRPDPMIAVLSRDYIIEGGSGAKMTRNINYCNDSHSCLDRAREILNKFGTEMGDTIKKTVSTSTFIEVVREIIRATEQNGKAEGIVSMGEVEGLSGWKVSILVEAPTKQQRPSPDGMVHWGRDY